ncbi:MAG: hypothetical protein AAF211_13430, partial [Myxococcota bacterium]
MSALVVDPIVPVASGHTEVAQLPAPVPASDWIRALMAWPARILDGLAASATFPRVSLAERHRRLLRATPPEGWLALQPGLATVGDAECGRLAAEASEGRLSIGTVHPADSECSSTAGCEARPGLGITHGGEPRLQGHPPRRLAGL